MAFITQYAAVFWFSAGLALGSQAVLCAPRRNERGPRRALDASTPATPRPGSYAPRPAAVLPADAALVDLGQDGLGVGAGGTE